MKNFCRSLIISIVLSICLALLCSYFMDNNNTRVGLGNSKTGNVEWGNWMPYETAKQKIETREVTYDIIQHRSTIVRQVYSRLKNEPLPWEK